MTSADLIKLLVANGWQQVRQKGSHVQLKKKDVPELITIPHPTPDLKKGLEQRALKIAGLK